MDLDVGDKVRFKQGAYSTLKMGTQVKWRLELEGLIGEVEHKHWRGGGLPDLYRVRVYHPRSGITVTDAFTGDEIEGPLVEYSVTPEARCPECGGSIAEHQYHGFDGPEWRCVEPATDNAVTGGLRMLHPECDYRGALAECHSLHCPVHGKGKP